MALPPTMAKMIRESYGDPSLAALDIVPLPVGAVVNVGGKIATRAVPAAAGAITRAADPALTAAIRFGRGIVSAAHWKEYVRALKMAQVAEKVTTNTPIIKRIFYGAVALFTGSSLVALGVPQQPSPPPDTLRLPTGIVSDPVLDPDEFDAAIEPRSGESMELPGGDGQEYRLPGDKTEPLKAATGRDLAMIHVFSEWIGLERIESWLDGEPDREEMLGQFAIMGERLEEVMAIGRENVIKIMEERGVNSQIGKLANIIKLLPELEEIRVVGDDVVRELVLWIPADPGDDIIVIAVALIEMSKTGLFDIISPADIIRRTINNGPSVMAGFLKLAPYAQDISTLPQDEQRLFLELFSPHYSINPLEAAELTGIFERHGFKRVANYLIGVDKQDAAAMKSFLSIIFGEETAVSLTKRLTDWRRSGEIRGTLTELAIHIASAYEAHVPKLLTAIDGLNEGGNPLEAMFMARRYTKYRRLAVQLPDLKVTPEEIIKLASENVDDNLKIAVENLLWAMDEKTAFDAIVHRLRMLRDRFHTGDVVGPRRGNPPLLTFDLGDSMELRFERGLYEAPCGLQFSLYRRVETVATLGFQITGKSIQIVRYQGGKMSDVETAEFHKFSGGVDPIPWLAYAVGRHLLDWANSSNRALLSINGARIRMGYPHKRGGEPVEPISKFEDVRDYWRRKHPEIDQLRARLKVLGAEMRTMEVQTGRTAKELKRDAEFQKLLNEYEGIKVAVEIYERGPHTERIYNSTAHNLGFRGNPNRPWFRYTKASDKFGKNIPSRAGDPDQFQRSIEVLSNFFGGVPITDMGMDKWH